MTRIESDTVQIQKPGKEVYAFLSNLNNHQMIMPEQVTDWKSEEDTCEYTIIGTGAVHLKVKVRRENHLVSLEPNGRIPFPFEVFWHISPHHAHCEVKVEIHADLNPILRMMAMNPLKSFINQQVHNLQKRLDG
ncbi:MAG: hypothetical protein GC180_02450 [Bacteroidetes bacterium]|nr:hypothetical protein [Bacteroidota bacterium]